MQNLAHKLAQIARLAELNSGRDEFDSDSFFSRKVAELAAERRDAEIRTARPVHGGELPPVHGFKAAA